MTTVKLSPRLATAVDFVRPGRLLCDVGTDHAYLPIYLCESGTTPRAIASDVRPGPLERARLHIAACGLSDRIQTRLTDGLSGLETSAPEDITVFGMGGELIASILAAADFVRSPEVRLILQPMTHPELLRGWLFEQGFAILGERLSAEDDRIYQTICAEYRPDELPAPYTAAELLTGRLYPAEQGELHIALIRKTIRTMEARRTAKADAGRDVAEETDVIRALEELESTVAVACSASVSERSHV